MSITTYLNKIKNAIYGREIRGAIHDSIKQTYVDATSKGNTNMEVSYARGRFPSLGERLNSDDRNINLMSKQLDDTKYLLSLKRDKNRPIQLNELSGDVLSAINNGDGSDVEVLSIPRNHSVDYDKFATDSYTNNLIDVKRIMDIIGLEKGNNLANYPLEQYADSYWNVSGFVKSTTYKCFIFKLPPGTYTHRGRVRHIWIYETYPLIEGKIPDERIVNEAYIGDSTFTVDNDFYVMINMFNDSNDFILQYSQSISPIKKDKSYIDNVKSIYNPLANKTLLNFGDSIAAGDGDRDNNNRQIGYSMRIGGRNNMEVHNKAIGGATIVPRESVSNNILKQINDATFDGIPADFILFNGLTNDILNDYNIPLGYIENGYNTDFDVSTFSGAFQEVCKLLKTNWVNAKILYVRPHNMGGRDDEKQAEYGERAIEICKKWSIPAVDMFNAGGMNTKIADHIGLYTPDGDAVHPNGLGYEMFYVSRIESKMKSI